LTRLTEQDLLACDEQMSEPLELHEIAAALAARQLAANWSAALRDGAELVTLLEDVRHVVSHLLRWGSAVKYKAVPKPPSLCPFCGGNCISICEPWAAQSGEDETVKAELVEYQCRGTCEGRSFWT